ncbi:MAG TPA: amidohydrolase [Clostridia bacterium]|nr:amidohydrolase [Clostridia bacterium]
MKVIKNVKVLTMEGPTEVYEDVDVAIENGKIKEIGKDLTGDEIIDGEGHFLLPGFIDAHCHLGMWEDAIGFEGSDGNEMTSPITPQLRGIDAINPMDRTFDDAISGGVTSVSTGPGSANVMGGTFTAIKTAGKRIDDMIIKDPVAMKIAFGENPKRVYNEQKKSPSTRMAVAAELRDVLFQAKNYMEKREKNGDQGVELKYEALLPVLKKEIPLKAHAHRADDIFTAIRIAREFDLDITLEHVTEGHLIADELAKENLSCVVGPSFGARTKFELINKSFITAVKLQEAGVKVAIMTDHPVIPLENLNLCAQFCVKEGMDHYEALKAITINPAEIIGIEERVGSIKVGKDADLVLWDGDPLQVDSRVLLTMIDGKTVYKA